MNPNRMRWALMSAVVGMIALAGCSSNQGKTEAPAASAEVQPSGRGALELRSKIAPDPSPQLLKSAAGSA